MNRTKKPKRSPDQLFRTQRRPSIVDQLPTGIPLLRLLTARRVVFHCRFHDKLLASGEFIDDVPSASSNEQLSTVHKRNTGLLRVLYHLPMDFLEEYTTREADCTWGILNSPRGSSNIIHRLSNWTRTYSERGHQQREGLQGSFIQALI
jgi:hypothetical protein